MTDQCSRREKVGPEAAPVAAARRQLVPKVSQLLQDRNGLLPIWIRAPVQGPEHYSGFTRAKLYQLAAEGHIRSVSIREPGRLKGVRLFNLASILDFVARCEAAASEPADPEGP